MFSLFKGNATRLLPDNIPVIQDNEIKSISIIFDLITSVDTVVYYLSPNILPFPGLHSHHSLCFSPPPPYPILAAHLLKISFPLLGLPHLPDC